jgi:hypothetical protein
VVGVGRLRGRARESSELHQGGSPHPSLGTPPRTTSPPDGHSHNAMREARDAHRVGCPPAAGWGARTRPLACCLQRPSATGGQDVIAPAARPPPGAAPWRGWCPWRAAARGSHTDLFQVTWQSFIGGPLSAPYAWRMLTSHAPWGTPCVCRTRRRLHALRAAPSRAQPAAASGELTRDPSHRVCVMRAGRGSPCLPAPRAVVFKPLTAVSSTPHTRLPLCTAAWTTQQLRALQQQPRHVSPAHAGR